jgi:hypothetical protein
MGEQLRVGDRVRVKNADRPHGCRVGDTGQAFWITPPLGPGAGVVFVHCQMDGTGRLATFQPDEIERMR